MIHADRFPLRRRVLALCAAAATGFSLVVPANAAIVAKPVEHSAENAGLKLTPLGTYESGIYAESAAEIVAFHPASKRILTVNAVSGEVDILDASDAANPQKVSTVSVGGDKEINSVAVRRDGLAVAAVQQADKTQQGEALFFDVSTGKELGRVGVGSLPDNVHITADGSYALLANEGEPSNELNATGDDYAVDPEGSVSVIALPKTVSAPTEADARIADFRAFDGTTLPEGVRVFGPEAHDAKPSIDFEPEYITSADGVAYVTIQEANAIAVLDIASATVTKILPAHITDHSQVPLDTSNKDGAAQLRTLGVKGLSMPDSIGAFKAGAKTYFATANEGDAREWGVAEDEGGTGVYTEETELKDLIKEGKVCEGALGDVVLDEVANKKVAGNLKVTNASGWNEEKGCFDEVYSYGTRSFSIYDEAGNVVFDSSSQFEEISAKLHAEAVLNHNADNESAEFDDRSDNKGPEPEALAIGKVGDKTYAFVGAERLGGIFVYDVTEPANAKFTTYVNNRDFSTDEFPQAGDLGPEGFAFVDKKDSPTGNYMLIVGNEVSGTTTTYDIKNLLPEPPADDKDDSDGGFSSGSAQGSSAGTVVGIFALIAAIVGMLFAPGVRDLILRVLPENLRSELEKYF